MLMKILIIQGTYSVGNPPVEHQFKPGESGNPDGRPPGALGIAAQMKKILKAMDEGTEEEKCHSTVLAKGFISKAFGKKIKPETQLRALCEIRDTLEGKPVSTIDNKSSDGSMSPITKVELTTPKNDDSADKPTS